MYSYKSLYESDDYKTFKKNNFEVSYHFEGNIDSPVRTTTSNSRVISYNSVINEDSKKKGFLKFLHEKCENLDVSYEVLYDFFTKLTNKIIINKTLLINFNKKVI